MLFEGAALGDDGWSVEWPELDIQIGADTLYLDALAQNAADENTRIFIDWRARTGLPLNQAAEALGVSARSISRYSSGREAVPRSLALACLGWDFFATAIKPGTSSRRNRSLHRHTQILVRIRLGSFVLRIERLDKTITQNLQKKPRMR